MLYDADNDSLTEKRAGVIAVVSYISKINLRAKVIATRLS